ncbi:hypothetical protein ACFONG_06740 [Uliginosibacterium paludis]|uniref:Uncharacterized protein n=1 Tax=Uliginosibacterium paludis TaxID=1615952 RepID=A0ABV2CLA2_9RHOO
MSSNSTSSLTGAFDQLSAEFSRIELFQKIMTFTDYSQPNAPTAEEFAFVLEGLTKDFQRALWDVHSGLIQQS